MSQRTDCLLVSVSAIAFLMFQPVLFADYKPIDESKIVVSYYVDPDKANASDSNSGTVDSPIKTITEALERAVADKRNNKGVKVLIRPGLYREAGDIYIYPKGNKTDAPLIIEPIEAGKVIIDGSEIYRNWRADKTGSDLYYRTWTNNWGQFDDANAGSQDPWPDMLRRREIVFVNDRCLRQVLSKKELADDTFYVDEAGDKIYIKSKVDITTALVEIGIRRKLFNLRNIKNIIVRGITAQKSANGFISDAAFGINQCQNVLIEACGAVWNNFIGLSFWHSKDMLVTKCLGSNNGYKCSTGKNENLVIEDTELSYNNRRGAWGEYYAWDTAGIKAWMETSITFRRCRFVGNYSCGLWFDTDEPDTTKVVIEDCEFSGNYLQGIAFEKVRGPIDVNRCIFTENDWTGITSHTSGTDGATIRNCVFRGNKGLLRYGHAGAQIQFGGPIIAMDLYNRNWTVVNNILISLSDACPLIEIDNRGWGKDETFMGSFKSYGNTGSHPDGAKVFKIGDTFMNTLNWQKATGQETGVAF